MNCNQGSPHCKINVVGATNVHRRSHGWTMGYKFVSWMTCRNNYARANRLLSEIILKNALLDQLHHLIAKISNHRQIHTSIHKSERVAGCNNAVEYRQIFKPSTNNLDLWMRSELPTQYVAKFSSSIHEYELHWIFYFPICSELTRAPFRQVRRYFAAAIFVENNFSGSEGAMEISQLGSRWAHARKSLRPKRTPETSARFHRPLRDKFILSATPATP